MHKFISQTLRRAASVLATAVLLLQTTMPLVAVATSTNGQTPTDQIPGACYEEISWWKVGKVYARDTHDKVKVPGSKAQYTYTRFSWTGGTIYHGSPDPDALTWQAGPTKDFNSAQSYLQHNGNPGNFWNSAPVGTPYKQGGGWDASWFVWKLTEQVDAVPDSWSYPVINHAGDPYVAQYGPYTVYADPFTIPFDVGSGLHVIGDEFHYNQHDPKGDLIYYTYKLVDQGTEKGRRIPCEVAVPNEPASEDPCGPDNATWVLPENTDQYTWSVVNGKAVATATEWFIFPNGKKTVKFGPLVDSNVACPRKPKLTLKKHVVNDDGGNAKANQWKLRAKAMTWPYNTVINEKGDPLPFYPYGSWAATKTVEVKADTTYVLSEHDGPKGYEAGDWKCYGGNGNELTGNKVTLEHNENVTCWITNDDIAPKVTVKKVAYGGHGWEKFEFKLDQHGNSHDKHFWLGNMQSKTFEVKPGLVQVFEKNLPNNWELTGDSCLEKKHGKWVPMGAGTDFIAVLGGKYKCTFTNDKDGEVHGHKFNDRNANGKWDKGEEGLKDWTINLYQKTCQPRNNTTAANDDNPLMKVNKDRYIPLVDCSFDEKPYMTTTTKWNGSYKFTGVDLNRWYKVCEVQQDGWTQTKPNPDWFDGCYFIYVDRKSRVHVHKNFGNVEHSIEVEVTPVCVAGFPYLNWKVTANHFNPTQFKFDWYTNPGNVHVAGATKTIPANDGSVSQIGNVYTGSILWPGANPVLPDWPGWTFTNGKWVEDPSDFGGNLRPNAKVMVSVNPSTTAEVAYPPAESGCDPTNPQVLGTDTLANTGSPALLSIIAALSLVTIASYIVVGRKQN